MKFLLLCLIILIPSLSPAQKTEGKPRLVIGIVVDQMRNDFLFRFEDLYGEGGFKRLKNEGFYAANHHFSYMPTTTGPGHASIYTGTTPSVHGIVGNDWYDPVSESNVYCTEDSTVRPVGTQAAEGRMSPHRLKTTTITDELKLFWNWDSKVIGVALKDRAAILPAGHIADGAYWFSKGEFISSSWYFDQLPDWVRAFNEKNLPEKYLEGKWELMLPEEAYVASLPDDNPYEHVFAGEDKPTLPKDMALLARENGADIALAYSPFGNTLTFEFAAEAIRSEDLGADEITDFLTVSLSSIDILGHAYGPRSMEMQDAFLRLDKDLSQFLVFLDEVVGIGNYLVFLTADHGGADVAQFSRDMNLPVGILSRKDIRRDIEASLAEQFGDADGLIEEMSDNHIFLSRSGLENAGLEVGPVSEFIAKRLTETDGIYVAYPVADIMYAGNGGFPQRNVQRGLYPGLAGDVVWVYGSGWMSHGPRGTTHGLPFAYDTHVPFLLFGKGVKKGTTYRETHIRDIAPTLSMILDIPLPSGTTGRPVFEAIMK